MRETCKTCRYWQVMESLPHIGKCKRYPPASRPPEIHRNPADHFPDTRPEDWCGEWTAKPLVPGTPTGPQDPPLSHRVYLGTIGLTGATKYAVLNLDPIRLSTTGGLISYSAEDLGHRKGFGKAVIKQIRARLATLGLTLREDPPLVPEKTQDSTLTYTPKHTRPVKVKLTEDLFPQEPASSDD